MHAATIRLSPANTIRQRSPLIVRSLLSGNEATEHMADDFRTLVVNKGGVEAEDLHVLGWTQEQINKHAQAARFLALKWSVREATPVKPRRKAKAA
jgi:hypothetical protein